MADPAKIKDIAERNAKLLALRSDKGHLTGATRARWVDGLHAEIEDGAWRLAVDMPVKAGGEEQAPTPGTLGRGALAGCLVIGIAMWAARRGVPLDALEVEVEGDFDARGELAVGDVRPGYKEVRYRISIDSPASDQTIADLVDTAERHSPYVDVFARNQALTRVVHINGQEA